jgi:hypothetical protein
VKRRAVIIEQRESDVGLGNSALQIFLNALRFGDGLGSLGNILFQSNGVSQFAFSFALQFLKA